MKYYLFTVLFLALLSCTEVPQKEQGIGVTSTSAYPMDEQRQRTVPLEIYENTAGNFKNGLVIINAGYGCSNTEYTYLARYLGLKNYLVIATHHENETDEMLPSGENIYQARLPFWEEGILNLETVLQYAQENYPNVDVTKLNLIGHSNGGDIATLFATKFPSQINSLITLDHRRVPLPRNTSYTILSLRGDDFDADPGVLPTDNEVGTKNIHVVQLKDAGHNFLRDNGTEHTKKHILSAIGTVL